MVFSKSIYISSSVDDIYSRLKAQTQGCSRFNQEQSITFTLYKKVDKNNIRAQVFKIWGSASEDNEGVCIKYSIAPTVSYLLYTLVLIALIVYSLIKFFIGDCNVYIILVLSLYSIVRVFWVAWQVRECAARFEKLFRKTEEEKEE